MLIYWKMNSDARVAWGMWLISFRLLDFNYDGLWLTLALYSVVEYRTQADMQHALRTLNNSQLNGRILKMKEVSIRLSNLEGHGISSVSAVGNDCCSQD